MITSTEKEFNYAEKKEAEFALDQRIALLGKKHEEAAQLNEELNERNTDLEKDNERLAEEIEEKNKQIQFLSAKSHEFEVLSDKIRKAALEVESLAETKQKLSSDISDLTEKSTNIKTDFESIKSVTENEVSSLQSKKDSLQTEVNTIEEKLSVTKKTLSEKVVELYRTNEKITHSEEKYKQMIADEGVLLSSLNEKADELGKMIKDISINSITIKSQEQVINEKICEANEIINKANEEVKAKLHDIEEREGVISLEKSWLADKKAALFEYKKSLEAFFGKKINIKFD